MGTNQMPISVNCDVFTQWDSSKKNEKVPLYPTTQFKDKDVVLSKKGENSSVMMEVGIVVSFGERQVMTG